MVEMSMAKEGAKEGPEEWRGLEEFVAMKNSW
jgi:hypothetical protein